MKILKIITDLKDLIKFLVNFPRNILEPKYVTLIDMY